MIRTSYLLLGATLAATSAAWAQPPSRPIDLPLDTAVTPARVATAPPVDDMEREYPSLPRMMNLSGHAVMRCTADVAGVLKDCHVVSEEPAGLGFGAASIRSAAYFRVQPASREGRPVEGAITIPIHWKMEEADPAPEPPPPPVPAGSLLLARRVLELEAAGPRMQAVMRVWLSRSLADLAQTDDAPRGAQVLDAFNLGLSDEVAREMERQAHVLALGETPADLTATVAFLEGPAGRAWVQSQAQIQASAPNDFYARVARSARAHLRDEAAAPKPAAGAAAASSRP